MFTQELELCIARFVISLKTDTGITLDAMRRPFLTHETPDTSARVHLGPLEVEAHALDTVAVESGPGWQRHRFGQSFAIVYDEPQGSTGSPQRSRRAVLWDPQAQAVDLYVSGIDPAVTLDALVYHYLKIPLMLLLSRHAGLLVHASGVVAQGGGLLFVGPQDSGKSTMARLWHQNGQGQVLNDDTCAVRLFDTEPRVFGGPWLNAANYCSVGDVPLKAIFLIKHGRENRCVALSAVQALALFMPQVYSISWDEEGTDLVKSVVVRMLEQVPCYHLSFLPDQRVLDVVLRAARLGQGHIPLD